MQSYETVVVGAGPSGLTAALYLCRFGIKTALVEKLAPGGQLLKTYEIANYLGYPKGLEGWQLAENFSQHLEGFDLDRIAKGVESMERKDGLFQLSLSGGETIAGRSVIVCSGATPKKLRIPDEERLTGKGISYCAMCDGMFFRNKTVAMVGGGNSALEEALQLSKIVKHIHLVHRRERFRADKVLQDKLAQNADNITLTTSHTVVELHGEKALEAVTIEPIDGGPTRRISVDGLFVFIGNSPSAHFLPKEVERTDAGFIVTDCEMRTNLPGLFAAGDIRDKLCRQVSTAVGDGATAAYAAFEYLERTPE